MGQRTRRESPAVIAVDLGGTKLASALVTATGNLLCKGVMPLQGRTGRSVARLLRERINGLLALAGKRHLDVAGVGICVPGIACAQTGRVWAPNIPGWERYPLRQEIVTSLRPRTVRVVVDSDRAACILGETWQGAARGCRHAVFLAVGTGIGAGILVDGRVLRGAHDIAGAIGWLALSRPYDPAYAGCGDFEHHASGAGLAQRAARLVARMPHYRGALRRKRGLTAQDIFAAYDAGDAVAAQVLRNAVEYWGKACANLVSLLDPEKIIFGGGVFGPAARFLSGIRREARRWAQPVSMRRVQFAMSQLGGDAALYGAAYLALQNGPAAHG
jgi:glucokinase